MGLTEVFSRFSFRAPIAALGFGVGGGSPSSSPPPPARGGEGSGTSSSSSSSTNDKTAAAPSAPQQQQQQPVASLSLAGPAHHGGQPANGPTATAGPRSPVAAPGASSSSSKESSFVLVAYPAPQQQPQGPPPQELSPQQQPQLQQPQLQQPAAKPEAAGPCASPPSAVAATAAPQQGDGEEKSESAAAAASSTTMTTTTTTAPSSPETPAVMVRRIPVLPEWRERLPLVMLQSKPDGTNTPIGIIKELSGALSIEATAGDAAGDGAGDGGASVIEIRAQEWQQLKEAEALLRLTFRDYDGVSVWWFYTIPTFVSCIISGTTGTEVPELSNPAVGLKCAIAPYDENSTRRAFFLTCPEWDPLNAAYQRIRKGWNYWRYQSLEKQIDRALGVLYGVSIAPIKADGSCLFRAFARAVLGDEERHPETRAAIVACLRASEELRLFIVSDDEGEDSGAYAERYLEEMSKPGTWGDQVEITAFTRVYGRSVRVFSYNYSENRLLSVGTPIEEGQAPQGPEVWLLHLHGHYSLLAPGVAPKDEGWQRLLREFEEEKGEQPVAAAAAKAAVGAPGSKAGPATAAAATAVDAGREKEGETAKEAVVAGREGEQGRPATPMEEAEVASVASVAAAMEVEQEEGKREEGGRVLMRVCSSTTVTQTTAAAAAVGVEGSVVMVECTSSSTSQRMITATAAMAEGE